MLLLRMGYCRECFLLFLHSGWCRECILELLGRITQTPPGGRYVNTVLDRQSVVRPVYVDGQVHIPGFFTRKLDSFTFCLFQNNYRVFGIHFCVEYILCLSLDTRNAVTVNR